MNLNECRLEFEHNNRRLNDRRNANLDYLRDQTILEINLQSRSVDQIAIDRGDTYYNDLQLMPRTWGQAIAHGAQDAGVVYRTLN